jgi:uncharacterized protein YndB with AHSA1/START domain
MMDDGSADGTVDVGDDGHAIIRFDRHLPAAIDEVWGVLTDPVRLAQWWGEVDLELRVGGRFDVTWFNLTPEGERFTMNATVTALEPPRLLETRGDVHGVLRWELTPEGGGTRLVFTSTLDLPDEFRTRTLAGWHYHLAALRHVLGGGSVDLVELPEWSAMHERYVARES